MITEQDQKRKSDKPAVKRLQTTALEECKEIIDVHRCVHTVFSSVLNYVGRVRVVGSWVRKILVDFKLVLVTILFTEA